MPAGGVACGARGRRGLTYGDGVQVEVDALSRELRAVTARRVNDGEQDGGDNRVAATEEEGGVRRVRRTRREGTGSDGRGAARTTRGRSGSLHSTCRCGSQWPSASSGGCSRCAALAQTCNAAPLCVAMELVFPHSVGVKRACLVS